MDQEALLRFAQSVGGELSASPTEGEGKWHAQVSPTHPRVRLAHTGGMRQLGFSVLGGRLEIRGILPDRPAGVPVDALDYESYREMFPRSINVTPGQGPANVARQIGRKLLPGYSSAVALFAGAVAASKMGTALQAAVVGQLAAILGDGAPGTDRADWRPQGYGEARFSVSDDGRKVHFERFRVSADLALAIARVLRTHSAGPPDVGNTLASPRWDEAAPRSPFNWRP
jgi:hypothetical protein